MEWTAEVTVGGWTEPPADADVERVIDAWAVLPGGALGVEPTHVEGMLTVEGTDLIAAAEAAIAAAHTHIVNILGGEVRAVAVMTHDEADRRADTTTLPRLVGIAEIAERLGVTRQRAQQLRDRLPPPVVELRYGPVWRESDVVEFIETWDRKPGRRPQTKGTA